MRLRSRPSPVHHHAGSVRAVVRAQQSLRALCRLGACPSARCPSLALPVQTISLPVRRALADDDSGCAPPVQTHFAAIPAVLSGAADRYSANEDSSPTCSVSAGLDVWRFLLVLGRYGGRGPSVRNLSTTLRHWRLRFTEQSLLLWIWQVG